MSSLIDTDSITPIMSALFGGCDSIAVQSRTHPLGESHIHHRNADTDTELRK